MSKFCTQWILFLISIFFLNSGHLLAQGTWTPLVHLAPDANNGVMLLMTDGSVICHTSSGGDLGDGTIWDRLTPDQNGSYVNGAWSQIAPMNRERFSFSSAVLKDGRVYAAGGEYGTDGTQNGSHGEIYNLTTNTWTQATGPNAVMSDGDCKLLDNGTVLQALVNVPYPTATVVYSPTTNAYTTGPPTIKGQNESMWLKLPDNSVLMVDESEQTSERFIPSLNQWVADGNVPVALYDPYGAECGPAWMLPDGRAFFIGGTNHTAYYTPSGTNAPGTWAAGPDVPNSRGMPDAPGAMMVNGKILIACSAQPTRNVEFAKPAYFYEFDYLTNTYTQVNAPEGGTSVNAWSQQCTMLDLPDGTVLFGLDQDQTSNQYYIYTPSGTPLAAGKPVINTVNRLTCTSYMATGTGFNGISEGSAYGDENECDSNYPLFRFISGGKVYYARSYNWNSTGVQRGNKPDTAYFTIPNTMNSGVYSMYAVANGIASDPVSFTDSVASLSSSLTPPAICTGTTFAYAATSGTSGATYTWTRAAVTGISNAAITTPQTVNPNEVLVNTTSHPVTVTYAYSVNGDGCNNTVNVPVVVNPKPTASFTAFPTNACYLPDSVSFTNTSIAGGNYTWSFGDNNTSSATSPTHAYLTGANYTVKLVALSSCGVDSITHANLIVITPPSAPSVTSPVTISCGNSATLSATGSDTLKWFNQAYGGNLLGTGTSFTTQTLNTNTTYYVESNVISTPAFCPPLSNSFGSGSNYTNSNFRSDVFNVNQACTLVSVLVVSGAAGNRTIQLQDSLGNVLQSKVVNIANGTSTITLNFPLAVGTEYQLGCGDDATTTNLYRNATGAAFPYSDPDGYITITGNNVPDAIHFYFFYNWKLQGPSCISARTPVAVNIANSLNISAGLTPVSCFGANSGGATIQVSGGTPGYTYQWSNGNTTASISNVLAGTYTVTSTDAHGCSGTASENITQPGSALNVSIAPVNAGCGLSNGSATAISSGGTSGYTYSWNNAATTAGISNLISGNYSVTVKDANNCTATSTTAILSRSAVIETEASVPTSCFGGSDGTASVNITSGTAPYAYAWSNGDSTASISNLQGGSIYVTITDGDNCQKVDTVLVGQASAINISITPVQAGCGLANGSLSANATGGASGYSYNWSNDATGASIRNLAVGAYVVTVTDANNCTSSLSANVSNPPSIIETHTATDVNCNGNANGGVLLNITGGTTPFSYIWNNGATTSSLSNLSGGTYSVTITDSNSCQKVDTIVVNEPAVLYGAISATNDSCFGNKSGTAKIIPGGGTSPYRSTVWSNGETTSTITALGSGNYTVTITDANNCTATANITLTEPNQLTITTDSIDAGLGQSNGSAIVRNTTGGTSPYTYLWSTGATTSTITEIPAGTYSVTITDAYGCILVSTVVVNSITGVANVSANLSFTLSPNPASNQLMVMVDKWGNDMTVSLKDILGQTLINRAISTQNTVLDLSVYAGGVYFIEVKQGEKQAVKQFVISK